MSTTSFNNILSSSTEMQTVIHDLQRITLLHSRLSTDQEKRAIQLAKIEQNAQAVLQLTTDGQPTLKRCKKQLDEAEVKISDLYFSSTEKKCSREKIQEIANHILEDLPALIAIPIQQPQSGAKGPTFIVDYTHGLSNPQIYSYVIKGASDHEYIVNLIYRQCLAFAESQCHIPQLALVDFSKNLFISPSGKAMPLTDHSDLKSDFASIAKTMQKLDSSEETEDEDELGDVDEFAGSKESDELDESDDETVETKTEIIFEKLSGKNIGELICSDSYNLLSPADKLWLFTNIGYISTLDLLMGNLDRFFCCENGHQDHLTDKNGANLGNVIVVRNSDSRLQFCPIDNTISPFLCLDASRESTGVNRAQACQDYFAKLIENTLTKPCEFEKFMTCILQSIRNSSTKSKPLNACFAGDLAQDDFKGALRVGIIKMHRLIKEKIIPSWNGSFVPQELRQDFELIMKPLAERMQLFNQNVRGDD